MLWHAQSRVQAPSSALRSALQPPLHGRFVQTKLSMVNFGMQLPLVVCEIFCSLIVCVLPLELVQKCQWAQSAVPTCRAWASAPSSSSKLKFQPNLKRASCSLSRTGWAEGQQSVLGEGRGAGGAPSASTERRCHRLCRDW